MKGRDQAQGKAGDDTLPKLAAQLPDGLGDIAHRQHDSQDNRPDRQDLQHQAQRLSPDVLPGLPQLQEAAGIHSTLQHQDAGCRRQQDAEDDQAGPDIFLQGIGCEIPGTDLIHEGLVYSPKHTKKKAGTVMNYFPLAGGDPSRGSFVVVSTIRGKRHCSCLLQEPGSQRPEAVFLREDDMICF